MCDYLSFIFSNVVIFISTSFLYKKLELIIISPIIRIEFMINTYYNSFCIYLLLLLYTFRHVLLNLKFVYILFNNDDFFDY